MEKISKLQLALQDKEHKQEGLQKQLNELNQLNYLRRIINLDKIIQHK